MIYDIKIVISSEPPNVLENLRWILATKAVTRDDLRLIARIVPMPMAGGEICWR